MSVKLTTDQINYLNIFLMVLSAGIALLYPFELFLLAYAVLGPLHYLTEISWLHDKKYYTQRKFDYLFLVAAGVGIAGLFLGLFQELPILTGEGLVFVAFSAGLVFLLFKNNFPRLMAFLIIAPIGLLMLRTSFFGPVFGMLFPTLIHVFVFTGLFILGGALRGRSISGFGSLLVFIGIACGLLFFHPAHSQYQTGEYVRNNYGFLKEDGVENGVFISLNLYIVKAFGLHDFGPPTQPILNYVNGINDFLYQSPIALSLMSFIAFSYTYHYLNWFSKTSIIRWHEVSRWRMAVVGFVWIASLVLYAWNYSLGFRWLFFLSFAHVLLEFPLNHLTMINIGKDSWRLISGKQKAVGLN